jgi:hypothetical protein
MNNLAALQRLPRRLTVTLAIVVILGLQLAITLPKLDLPVLDGQMHYNFDNCLFTTYARNGIDAGGAKGALGITLVSHTAYRTPAGAPGFYTHHPFLFKALFQQYVRIFGDAEWVPRSFALIVACIATTGIFTALFVASDSVIAAFLGAAVMVGIPLFAIFQSCIKYEIDGMAAGSWFFVAAAVYLRRPSRQRLFAVALLALLSALAHWTALLLVGATVAWLAAEWLLSREKRALHGAVAGIVGAAAGTLAVFAAFIWLNGGFGPFVANLSDAAAVRSNVSQLPFGAWLQRQVIYVGLNFGKLLPLVAALVAARLGGRWLFARLSGAAGASRLEARLLPAFFFATLATACAWQFGFRQGSFVHTFWQLWFCVPVAALVALGIRAAAEKEKSLLIAVTATVLLAAWLQISSYDAYSEMVAQQQGVAEDVQFLKSLRHETFSRFVFLPTEQTQFNSWFNGPLFDYYTDRSVAGYQEGGALGAGDKVLILRHENQEMLAAEVGKALGINLVNAKYGPRFCAYDVVKR